MAIRKTAFVCQECGYRSPRWAGRCPECGRWNSLAEEAIAPPSRSSSRSKRKGAPPRKLSQIKKQKRQRISSRIGELDRVLGGGIVPGSVVLVAGEPGVGKSTLLLQAAERLNTPVLYLSGEESAEQVKLRAERLRLEADHLSILAETDVDLVLDQIEDLSGRKKSSRDRPAVVIVDSIQSLSTEDLSGTPGSVGQVRQCAHRLHQRAKKKNFALFLIGHVTKAGGIAGPKVLEHLVDAVLYFQGERTRSLRLLRCLKNRFGPTDEVGVFQMGERGLEEVTNPSEIFLSRNKERTPGSVVAATMEGNRVILAEIQALVVPSFLSVPRRTTSGLPYQRLVLLSAVLEKTLKLPLGKNDLYLNVVGGLKLSEPAADLGVCLAIISSLKNQALKPKTAVFGEVGLLGEIRPVSFGKKREKGAEKLGFSRLISPEKAGSLQEAVGKAFSK